MLAVMAMIFVSSLALAYTKLGNQAVLVTNSANAALSSSLKGDLAALPGIGTVTPGITSGNLDHVATARQNLSKKLLSKEFKSRQLSPLYYPFKTDKKLKTNHGNYDNLRKIYSSRLNLTVLHLSNLKKLCQYNAAADLGESLASDSSTAERLQRTKTGLEQAQIYIRNSSLFNKQSLLEQLDGLISDIDSLTDQSKAAWIAKVHILQRNTLDSITTSDIQQTDYAKELEKITAYYQ